MFARVLKAISGKPPIADAITISVARAKQQHEAAAAELERTLERVLDGRTANGKILKVLPQ